MMKHADLGGKSQWGGKSTHAEMKACFESLGVRGLTSGPFGKRKKKTLRKGKVIKNTTHTR